MEALSGMYEKPSTNNKVHLMKTLFALKMIVGTSVTQHLNNFNTITNQLSSIEIEFDDEIRALILLASLPSSWEGMRTAMSNSARKSKLNMMTSEIWFWLKKCAEKTLVKIQVQLSTLILEGGDMIEAYPEADQNQDIEVKASLDPESRLNVGIVANLVITWGVAQN